MSFLEVKNLHVEVEDKKILNGLTLSVEKGQVAARLLIQMIKGKTVDSPPPLSTRLVIRGSTSKAKHSTRKTGEE